MNPQIQNQIADYILEKQKESGALNHLCAHFTTLVAEKYHSNKGQIFQIQRNEKKKARIENAVKIAQAIVLYYFRFHNLTYSLRCFGVEYPNIDDEFNYLLEKKRRIRRNKNQNNKPKYDNKQIQEYLMEKFRFQTDHFISFLINSHEESDNRNYDSDAKPTKSHGSKYRLSCVLLSQKYQTEHSELNPNIISYSSISRGSLINPSLSLSLQENNNNTDIGNQQKQNYSKRSYSTNSGNLSASELTPFNSFNLYRSSDSKLEPIELTFDEEEDSDNKSSSLITSEKNIRDRNKAVADVPSQELFDFNDSIDRKHIITEKQQQKTRKRSRKSKRESRHSSSSSSQSHSSSESESHSRSESESQSRSESESHSSSSSSNSQSGKSFEKRNKQTYDKNVFEDERSSRGSESERNLYSEYYSLSSLSMPDSFSESPYLSGPDSSVSDSELKLESESEAEVKPRKRHRRKSKTKENNTKKKIKKVTVTYKKINVIKIIDENKENSTNHEIEVIKKIYTNNEINDQGNDTDGDIDTNNKIDYQNIDTNNEINDQKNDIDSDIDTNNKTNYQDIDKNNEISDQENDIDSDTDAINKISNQNIDKSSEINDLDFDKNEEIDSDVIDEINTDEEFDQSDDIDANEETVNTEETDKNQEPNSQSHSVFDSSFDISNINFSQPDPRFIKKDTNPDDTSIDKIDSTFIDNSKIENINENNDANNNEVGEDENEANEFEFESEEGSEIEKVNLLDIEEESDEEPMTQFADVSTNDSLDNDSNE